MDKIASPRNLVAELQSLIDLCASTERPSREKLAAEMRSIAARLTVEGSMERIAWGEVPLLQGMGVYSARDLEKLLEKGGTKIVAKSLKIDPRYESESDGASYRFVAKNAETGETIEGTVYVSLSLRGGSIHCRAAIRTE